MHALKTLAIVCTATAALAACSGDEEPTTSASDRDTSPTASSTPSNATPTTPTETATPTEAAGSVLEVSVEGDTVSPNAEGIELAAGETLTVEVTSDRDGELHVHSKPEQYVEFVAGGTTVELAIETPGVVEIEEHDTGAVVARLEVRE